MGTYINGGWSQEEPDDDGLDRIGNNPTGRPRKSSARQRRKKIRKLFGGTGYEKPEDKKKKKK
jgi:hypothetical protein